MKVILKVRDGYINTDNGITICKKEQASKFSMQEFHSEIEKIYAAKPMIGKIDAEPLKF